MLGWLIPLVLFLAALVVAGVAWVVVSYNTFPNKIMPGEFYDLDDKTYQVPSLPHMQYNSSQEPSMDREIPMLDKTMLRDLRSLMKDSFTVFREAGLDFWATGGTLISAMLWAPGLMPYDDDIDVAVDYAKRDYTWSPEFATLLAKKGLETFFLRGASLNFATREGAALRVRRKGTYVPTLDLFYVREREDGSWSKVNTWYGDNCTYSSVEVWPTKDWLFPLREIDMGDFKMPIGNEPEKMLDAQYGPDWKRYIKSPNPMTRSHRFAFMLTNFFSAWRVGEVNVETKPVN